MAIKSLSHSSLTDNKFYRSMLVGNTAYLPLTSDYYFLETQVLDSTQGNIIFDNLVSSYGSDFQHLQIRATMRTTRGATGDALYMRLDGNTGSVYSTYTVRNNAVYNPTFSSTNAYMGDILSNIDETYNYATILLDITDPFETSKNTSFKTLVGSNNIGSGQVNKLSFGGGVFQSTSAVNKLDFYNLSYWAAGTRFSLYGLKVA